VDALVVEGRKDTDEPGVEQLANEWVVEDVSSLELPARYGLRHTPNDTPVDNSSSAAMLSQVND
jgi:hypothetical protein